MKKILTMAAVALLAASCSNDKDVITPDLGTANAPVAIKLTQSVEGITTKAPITSGSQVEGIVVMVDVTSGHEHDWGSFNPVYKNEIDGATKELKTRANVAGAVFTAGTETDITLTPTLYYDNEQASPKSAHITAVVPSGTIESSKVVFGKVDGLQDVMTIGADQDAGTAASPNQNGCKLTFAHKTTQLVFAASYTSVAGGKGEWEGKNVSIKSIKILGTQLPQSVNLTNGDVNWATASDFSVPNITTTALSTTASTISPAVMLAPSNDIKLNVTINVGGTDRTFLNVPVMDSKNAGEKLNAQEGYAHTVTLNITEPDKPIGDNVKALEVKATVNEWKQGNGGTVELK
ncbi:hypothetical protein DW945_06620 [Parabacteroides sp. AM44-16]|jgi:hypothetical protein|nr:hypothetical protein DW945_06620 [Parabacteroides sp. AM44-16]